MRTTSTSHSSALGAVYDDDADADAAAGGATTKTTTKTKTTTPTPSVGRREALTSAFSTLASSVVAVAVVAVVGAPAASVADDYDLTSRMFNPDGSLRDSVGVETEAKTRTVELTFPSGGGGDVLFAAVDGTVPSAAGGGGGGVKVTYNLPAKWTASGPNLYLDTSEGVNAPVASRISAYVLPGPADPKTLQRAATIGVSKALGVAAASALVGYDVPKLAKADLVSGRKRSGNDNDDNGGDQASYYEFDLAAAPATCSGKSSADLGLGFCPYDSIALLGATIAGDGRMYVICVECDDAMWRRGNADLKRVRSSFRVEVAE